MIPTRFSAQAGSLWKSENSSFFLPRDHKTCCLFMGLLGLYMGKVTRVRKKLVGTVFFLKLVRPLVLSDPACSENRVRVLLMACSLFLYGMNFEFCKEDTPNLLCGKIERWTPWTACLRQIFLCIFVKCFHCLQLLGGMIFIQ